MTPRRVLVTGATGRLGKSLLERLGDTGLEVVPLVSVRSGSAAGIPVDLADPAAVVEAMRDLRLDSVVHLASINGAACDRDPALTRAVNVDATRELAALARRAGAARFVHLSSAAVYGTGYDRAVVESDALLGQSLYGRSKAEAEAALARGAAEGGMTSVSLRVFNLYGPTFIHSLITRLANSRADDPVTLVGLDRFLRDYVHVDDVVDSIVAALDADLPAGHSTFNVGSGTVLSNREVVALLERWGRVHYVVAGDEASMSGAAITQAQRVLGFMPRRTVGDAG